MLFSSLVFMFMFLPATLAVYYILPRHCRNFFLLVANLVFYGFGEPAFVILMVISIFLNYTGGLMIARVRTDSRKKLTLALTLGINLLLLGIFKYAGFIADTLRLIPPLSGLPELSIPLPIGISFYTFQGMSYLIDVYRRDCEAQKSMVIFGSYISLFPQLIAGPIVRYRDVAEELNNPFRESVQNFSTGAELFLVGLSKKVLLANPLGTLWSSVSANPDSIGVIGAWCGAASFSMQLYFDFSGYSDMARGLGKMLGLTFCENFNYPYLAGSVTDFWRRWHMSLTTWFRDYVYIPLGGNRCSPPRVLLNIAAVWALTGLWHGASWNFVLWGVYYAFILILEKVFILDFLKNAPAIVGRAYTLIIVMFGWMLFELEDTSLLIGYLSAMFGHNAVTKPAISSLIIAYAPFLGVAAFACTPAARKLFSRLPQRAGRVLAGTASVLSLLLCTAALVSDSYNPFLYFRF